MAHDIVLDQRSVRNIHGDQNLVDTVVVVLNLVLFVEYQHHGTFRAVVVVDETFDLVAYLVVLIGIGAIHHENDAVCAFQEVPPVHDVACRAADVYQDPVLFFVLYLVESRSVGRDVVVDKLAFAEFLAKI